MKKVGILNFVLIAVVFFISCDKNDSTINQEIVTEIKSGTHNDFNLFEFVKLNDERLVFENKNSFDLVIDFMFNNQEKLDEFENKFPGFVSSRMAFNQLNEDILNGKNVDLGTARNYAILSDEEGEIYLNEVVFPHLLAPLFNKDGLLQIGDILYKFTNNYTIKAHLNYMEELLGFDEEKMHPDFSVYPHEIEIIDEFLFRDDDVVCRNNYTTRRRLRGRLGRTTTLLYNSLYVSTTSLRQSLGIWVQFRVDEVSVVATGQWYMPPIVWDTTDFNVSSTGLNQARTQRTIVTSGLTDVFPYYISGNGTHRLRNGNHRPQCLTSR